MCFALLVASALGTAAAAPQDGLSPLRLLSQQFTVAVNPQEGTVRVDVTWLLSPQEDSLPSQFYVYLTNAAELHSVHSPQRKVSWRPSPSFIPFFNAVAISLPQQTGTTKTFRLSMSYSLKRTMRQTGLGALSMLLGPDLVYLFECWTPTLEPLLDSDGFVRKVQKSPFTATIEVPAGYVGLTVGQRIKEELRAGKALFHYRCEGPPPLLIPLLVGRWVKTTFSEFSSPLEVFSPQHTQQAELRGLARVVAEAYAKQAELLRQPPGEGLRVVLADTGGLARGFPDLLVLPPFFTSAWALPSVKATICHEIAHRYFGNLVTAYGPGGNEFLAEGLATYVGILTVGALDGPRAERRLWRQYRDEFLSSEAEDVPIVHVRPMQNVLSGEVYRKGALICHELSRWVGQETVWKILAAFLERFEGSYATCRDFRRVAQQLSTQDLEPFFTQYLERTDLPWVVLEEFHCRAAGDGSWLTALTLRNLGRGLGVAPVQLRESEKNGGHAVRRSLLIKGGQQLSVTVRTPFRVKQCLVDPDGTFLHGVRRASLLRKAKDLRRKGQLDRARKLLTELSTLLPEDGEVWYAFGRTEEAAGNLPKAVTCYRKAAEYRSVPWLPTWAWLREAQCRRKQGNTEGAVRLFRRVLNEGADLYGAFETARKELRELTR